MLGTLWFYHVGLGQVKRMAEPYGSSVLENASRGFLREFSIESSLIGNSFKLSRKNSFASSNA